MFDGLPVNGSDVLVRYTYSGDADLDGVVGTSDFTALSTNFNAQNSVWAAGDFNYDGKVNALDFNALASNFGQSLPSEGLGTLAPEPSIGLLALLLTGVSRRTKRKHGKFGQSACADGSNDYHAVGAH